MKKIGLFLKIGLLSIILVLCLLTFSARADNISKSNDTDNLVVEYYIIVNDNKLFGDDVINITVDETLKFGIWDNKSSEFTKDGKIKIKDEVAKIKPQNFIDIMLNIVGVTVGKNEGFFAEHKFNESPEAKDYSVNVIGEYSSKQTKNTIIINVKSNYITRAVGKVGKQYDLETMKKLNGRSLKFHKNNAPNVEKLINNSNEFLEASNNLYEKISNLTDNPGDIELKNSVGKVTASQKALEASIKEYEDKTKDIPLIKDQSSAELKSINYDITGIINDLKTEINTKRDSLLKNELGTALGQEKTSSSQFETAKSEYISGVFNPAGALILLGIIIGFLNVNRWKKESEYFGLYTSKATITSPVTIAIILTIIIFILIGAVVYSMTGNFDMFINTFKFLI